MQLPAMTPRAIFFDALAAVFSPGNCLFFRASCRRPRRKQIELRVFGFPNFPTDAALCTVLAYYTNRDPERIDRLFRSSSLYRAKWDRLTAVSTYGKITIQTAVRSTVA
jgi:hypothetical protein